ncbi:unnamed protein product, partial [marine sediment metagenome]
GMAALALPGCLRQMAKSQARSKPNIVIIFADDMGYGDPRCYNGQSKIPTPHIDKLAGQGMRFTDAHTAAAVCTPSRYGLLTGRYCWRSRLKRGILWHWDEPLIEPERLTLPGMLQQSGYHTGCVGKWHLGWNWPTTDGSRISETAKISTWSWNERIAFGNKVDFTKPIKGGPITRGFDYYFGDDVPNFAPYCFIENDRVIKVPASTKPKNMFGNPGPAMADWQLNEVMPKLTTRAVKYIEQRSQTTEQPFFLYFSLTAPHTPIAPVEPFIGKSQAGLYGDYVHQVDATVGEI